MVLYMRAVGKFGCDMAVQRTIVLPRRIQLQISMHFICLICLPFFIIHKLVVDGNVIYFFIFSYLYVHVWWKTTSLQKFVIQVLSWSHNASGCKRNWSVFETIHAKKHKRLEYQCLKDMAFLCYNLWLWIQQLTKPPNVDAICLDDAYPMFDKVVGIERNVMEDSLDWLGGEDAMSRR